MKIMVESHDEDVISILKRDGIRFVEKFNFIRQDLKAMC